MADMRIGVFGGTFNPPHIAHLILADETQHQLSLDLLLWVLTADPPHKQNTPITPLEHRLEMVRLALVGEPRNELSRIEIDRPGPHFAVDTLHLLAEEYPQAVLVYLMGGDSLQDLIRWHLPGEFVKACDELGVMRRPEDQIDLPGIEAALPGISKKIRFVDAPLLEISSSEIRRRVAEGRPFRHYLPTAVYNYIQANNLYG